MGSKGEGLGMGVQLRIMAGEGLGIEEVRRGILDGSKGGLGMGQLGKVRDGGAIVQPQKSNLLTSYCTIV